MVERSQIRPQMDVIASDGEHIGTVDAVEGERIKLAMGAADGAKHHHVDVSDVSRVDSQVHLSKTRAALGPSLAAAATGASKPASPLPPIRNPSVDGAAPRRNYMLPWVLAGLALLIVILALSQCDRDDGDNRATGSAAPDAPAVVIPRVAGAPLIPGTLAFDLDRFMGSKDGLPRTFAFDVVNFDSGTANLRAGDDGDLNDIARVLAASPDARAAIVGYADVRGGTAFNRDLGASRARAVIAALGARGVPADRLEARSGGETDPAATNATPGNRFDNRRTELVIVKR